MWDVGWWTYGHTRVYVYVLCACEWRHADLTHSYVHVASVCTCRMRDIIHSHSLYVHIPGATNLGASCVAGAGVLDVGVGRCDAGREKIDIEMGTDQLRRPEQEHVNTTSVCAATDENVQHAA